MPGLRPLVLAFAVGLAALALVRPGEASARSWSGGVAVVGYESPAALRAALARRPATVLRRIPQLGVAEVRPRGPVAAFAAALRTLPGIAYVEARRTRERQVEPAVDPAAGADSPEWQWAATRSDLVPESVARAAAAITIAVVDTGADVTAPDIAAKAPAVHSVLPGDSEDVRDANGHGTFVAALAAGSVTNGDGIAGLGGDARLLVVRASDARAAFTDVDEAAAITYAVDHGARVVNLSLGGPETSSTEREAIDYAVSRDVLLVAAAGNESGRGNPVEYPAALLQPVGSRGQGGVGLAVAASDRTGARAPFSNTGTYVSLAAPGEDVLSAVSADAPAAAYPRVALPGAKSGQYGFASGTSFAAPQVAGAAALVWAANPALAAADVARILKETASNRGGWNPETGYGVIDVAAAVAAAGGPPAIAPEVALTGRRDGRVVQLEWSARGADSFRVAVALDGGAPRVVVPITRRTTASYSVSPGHSYAFTVAAVAADGAPAATSNPFEVRLLRARSTLRLTARPSAQRQWSFAATVRPAGAGVAPAGRTVVLEAFDGRGWRRAGTATTASDGRAAWTFRLGAGSYRIRARVVPQDDLAAVTSASVSLRIR